MACSTLRVSIAGLVAVLLGCGVGRGSSNKCAAAISYHGKRMSSVGTGSSKSRAKKSAETGTCLAYCDYADPTVDAAYRKWRATPDGQKEGAARDKSVALGFVMSLKQEVSRCRGMCAAAVKSGQAQMRSTCL